MKERCKGPTLSPQLGRVLKGPNTRTPRVFVWPRLSWGLNLNLTPSSSHFCFPLLSTDSGLMGTT